MDKIKKIITQETGKDLPSLKEINQAGSFVWGMILGVCIGITMVLISII